MNAIRIFALTASVYLGLATTGYSGETARHHRVEAYTTDTYTWSMSPGSLWQLSVEGDGDTDLDFELYESVQGLDGRLRWVLVRFDLDHTDCCYFRGSSIGTGEFRLKIRNLGGVYNRFLLTSNVW